MGSAKFSNTTNFPKFIFGHLYWGWKPCACNSRGDVRSERQDDDDYSYIITMFFFFIMK